MIPSGMRLSSGRPAAVRKASLVFVACLVLAAACGSAPAPRQVATLRITDGYPLRTLTLKAITARIPAGSEFSVIVDTTDGPLWWTLTTSGLPSIVQPTGSASVGSCPTQDVGCRVPERYTFLARARGATTMVWAEDIPCPDGRGGCKRVIQPIRLTVT